jgi:hypothetical protein
MVRDGVSVIAGREVPNYKERAGFALFDKETGCQATRTFQSRDICWWQEWLSAIRTGRRCYMLHREWNAWVRQRYTCRRTK